MSEDAHPRPEAPDRHPPAVFENALKRAAAVLREADVPFLLCGSVACWARGGLELATKDVDFCVRQADAERALEALAGAGMRTERPPEGWLVKAWDDDVLIDLLFSPVGLPVTDEVLDRGDELEVLAMPMRVAAVDDIVSTKLLALDEHSLDYEQLLQIARNLREQIHWATVRERAQGSPYAMAFFTLVEQLGIVSPEDFAGVGEVPPQEPSARAVRPSGSRPSAA